MSETRMPRDPAAPTRDEVVQRLRDRVDYLEHLVAEGVTWSNDGDTATLAALYRAALRDCEAMAALEAGKIIGLWPSPDNGKPGWVAHHPSLASKDAREVDPADAILAALRGAPPHGEGNDE